MAEDREYIIKFSETGADRLLAKIKEIDERLEGLGRNGGGGWTPGSRPPGGAGPGGGGPDKPTVAVSRLALTFAKRVLAVGVAIKAVQKALQTSQEGQRLGNIADVAGVTTKALQQFGGAIKILGGDAKAAYQSFRQMQTSITGLKFGEGGALEELMYKFGVNPLNDDNTLKTPQQLFKSMADVYKNLSKEDRAYFAQTAGWTPEMAKLAEGGSAEVQAQERLAKQYAISEESLKAQAELAKSWNELLMSTNKGWNELVGWAAEILSAAESYLTVIINMIAGVDDELLGEKVVKIFKPSVNAARQVLEFADKMKKGWEVYNSDKNVKLPVPEPEGTYFAAPGTPRALIWGQEMQRKLQMEHAARELSAAERFLQIMYPGSAGIPADNSVSTQIGSININTSRPASEVLDDLSNSGWNGDGMMLEAQGLGY